MPESHEVMTYGEILEAEQALTLLLQRGCRDRKTAVKLARMHRWVKQQANDFREAKKVLKESHAVKNEDGDYVPALDEKGNPAPGSFVPQNRREWDEELDGLRNDTINLNGVKITGSDLDAIGGQILNTDEDGDDEENEEEFELPPLLISWLGPLYDWDEDQV